MSLPRSNKEDRTLMSSRFANRNQHFTFSMDLLNINFPTFGSTPQQPLGAVKATEIMNSSPTMSSPVTSESEQVDSGVNQRAPSRARRDRSSFTQFSGLEASSNSAQPSINRIQEIRAAPIFSSKVEDALEDDDGVIAQLPINSRPYPQFSMLGNKIGALDPTTNTFKSVSDHNSPDGLLFLNMNEPFSTFICGAQGGGKSHTLSCMLEGGLLRHNPVGRVQAPSAAMVFHYDQFSSHSTSQVCEAAYLCSKGIPVRVMVSPTNYHLMSSLYSNLEGLKPGMPKPKVIPFFLKENHLHIENMKKLMSCAGGEAAMPLYLERVFSILKDMAMEMRSTKVGINYKEFRKQLETESFSKDQKGPLTQRLLLLDDFINRYKRLELTKASRTALASAWTFEPGSLTIVDLSCPFVSPGDACSLFTVALSIFLESRGPGESRMIALDEAHKFLNDAIEAKQFTDDLTSIIAQQRHLAARVIIATQEPTLSPRLLELSNVSIVHRFKSPQWFAALKKYLAGPEASSSDPKHTKIFEEIVNLRTGEALIFAPTAVIDVVDDDEEGNTLTGIDAIRSQGMGITKVMVRKRITVDGGRSVVAIRS